jgi:hypothetical protein
MNQINTKKIDMLLHLNWGNIADLLMNANETIVLCMPSIHEEWVLAIEENLSHQNIEIKVCIENSESVVRNGYGSVSSIDRLIKIKAQIQQCEGIGINYLRVDDEYYLIFLESRIIAGDPKGLNAFNIEEFQGQVIENVFFPKNIKEAESVIPLANEIFIVKPIDENQVKEIKAKLDENPPTEPDLKRQISTYTNLFQYAEVHFEGANLQSKTITIPKEAFPFSSKAFKDRIKTKYVLFSKNDVGKWNELLDYKSKVDNIRKKYLTPCSLKKNHSILKKKNRENFKKEVNTIKDWAKENVKKIKSELDLAINNAKIQIKDEIKKTIILFQSKELQLIKDESKKEKLINNLVEKVISKTTFPSADLLINGVKLDVYYADLTVEDIQDPKLIDWFKNKKLIDNERAEEIANFQKAYVVRK